MNKRKAKRQAKAEAAAVRRRYAKWALVAPVIVFAVRPLFLRHSNARSEYAITPWSSPPEIRGAPINSAAGTNSSLVNSNPAVKRLPTGEGPTVASSASLPEAAPAEPVDPEYRPISFQELSGFSYSAPVVPSASVASAMMVPQVSEKEAALKTLAQIPKEVRDLDGKKVTLKGFILPTQFDGDKATDFMLLKNQMACCYGLPPQITEWVSVHIVGKGKNLPMHVPVTIAGTFHVGEAREKGILMSIYQMDMVRNEDFR